MIIHTDCLSPAMRFAGEGADVQIVDPPYSANVHARAVSTRTDGAGPRSRDLGFASLSPALQIRICEYAAQVRRWTAIFTDIESVDAWRRRLEAHGVEYVRSVPWVRWTQPQISGDRPPSGCEIIILAHPPGKKHWSGPGSLTHFSQKALRGAGKHPTEKPLDLMLALVSYLAAPGESVLDPCAGSGSTALAARLLGRGAIGLERRADWADQAAQRVDTAASLSVRDVERRDRFVADTRAEATTVPLPKAADGSDVKTWERAQRRLADAETVEKK